MVFFTRDWGKNFDNWSSPLRNSWLDQYQDQPAKMSIISLSPLFLLLCSLPRHIWSSCSLWNYWSSVCKTYNGFYQWKWQALCSKHVFRFVWPGPAVLNQEWSRRGSASNLINCFLWELIQPKFRSGPWSCYNNNSEAGIIWEDRLWNTDSNGFMSRRLWWDQSVAGKTLKSYLYVRNTLHYSGINQK